LILNARGSRVPPADIVSVGDSGRAALDEFGGYLDGIEMSSAPRFEVRGCVVDVAASRIFFIDGGLRLGVRGRISGSRDGETEE
jgi:hypothetical protein